VRGEVAEFVTVIATTEGKVVRYVALDAGLQVFPSSLLASERQWSPAHDPAGIASSHIPALPMSLPSR
jgi:hypothetical protein